LHASKWDAWTRQSAVAVAPAAVIAFAHSARVVQTGSQGRLENNHGRKNESGCPKVAVEGRARATSEVDADEVPHDPWSVLSPLLHSTESSLDREVAAVDPGHRRSRHLGTERAICAPKPALMVSRRRAPIRQDHVLGRELSPTGDRQRSAAMH